jgi:hypothetical protein
MRHQRRRPFEVAAAATAIGEPSIATAPGRVEVAGEFQLGIKVVGADHRHRSAPGRAPGPRAWHRERHGRASAAELVEIAAAFRRAAGVPAAPGRRAGYGVVVNVAVRGPLGAAVGGSRSSPRSDRRLGPGRCATAVIAAELVALPPRARVKLVTPVTSRAPGAARSCSTAPCKFSQPPEQVVACLQL